MVEFVACLVIVTQYWEIELQEGWDTKRVWDVVEKSFAIITMAPPIEIPLVFKRRSN